MTPTWATSKQVIKVLLKELQKLHLDLQEIRTERTYNEVQVLDDLSENFKNNYSFVIDQDYSIQNQVIQTKNDFKHHQSNADEVKLSNPEEDRIEIIKEKKVSEESMKLTIFNNGDHILDGNEDNKSESAFNEADSEHEEAFNEKDVFSNIQLMEAFENQCYTFVVDESEEISEGNSYNQSFDIKKEYAEHRVAEKSFECEYCGKYFKTKSKLIIHKRIHTGEKPYICKTCNKGFVQSSNMKVHERSHTGEKPHHCKTCKKAFIRIDSLKEHERILTGEKPYQCKGCNYTFNTKSNYRRHERLCHKRKSL